MPALNVVNLTNFKLMAESAVAEPLKQSHYSLAGNVLNIGIDSLKQIHIHWCIFRHK